MTKNTTLGVFLGRFQPFHTGHLSIVKEILDNHKNLLLIVGSSQESGTDKNPWTYEERKKTIEKSLSEEQNQHIEILGLDDTADDDVWGENLKKILSPPSPPFKGDETMSENKGVWKSKAKFSDSLNKENQNFILYTGNVWVRDICNDHDISCQFIDAYSVDISATKIREMMKAGEDVSQWTRAEKMGNIEFLTKEIK